MQHTHPQRTWADAITEFTASRQHLPHLQMPGYSYFTASNAWHRLILSPAARDITMDTILHHDHVKYRLDAAVVMPDHFHLIISPFIKQSTGDYSLEEIFQSIKSYASKKILSTVSTTSIQKEKRKIWQKENYDHLIRDDEDYRKKLTYLVNNPVEAGLVAHAEEYRWLYCPAIGKLYPWPLELPSTTNQRHRPS